MALIEKQPLEALMKHDGATSIYNQPRPLGCHGTPVGMESIQGGYTNRMRMAEESSFIKKS
jgi:hypothetical protein